MKIEEVTKIVKEAKEKAEKNIESVRDYAEKKGVYVSLEEHHNIRNSINEPFRAFYRIDGKDAVQIHRQILDQYNNLRSDLSILSIGNLKCSIQTHKYKYDIEKALSFILKIDFETSRKFIREWTVKEYKNGRLDLIIPENYFKKIYEIVMRSTPETERILKIMEANFLEFKKYKPITNRINDFKWMLHDYLDSKNIDYSSRDINELLIDTKLKKYSIRGTV